MKRTAIILADDLKYHRCDFSVNRNDRSQIEVTYSVKEIPSSLLENFEKNFYSFQNALFYTTDKVNLKDCYVAKVYYVDQKDNQYFVIDHWNYYPGRKQLCLTHSTKIKRDFNLLDSGIESLKKHLNVSIYETFCSLERLLT